MYVKYEGYKYAQKMSTTMALKNVNWWNKDACIGDFAWNKKKRKECMRGVKTFTN